MSTEIYRWPTARGYALTWPDRMGPELADWLMTIGIDPSTVIDNRIVVDMDDSAVEWTMLEVNALPADDPNQKIVSSYYESGSYPRHGMRRYFHRQHPDGLPPLPEGLVIIDWDGKQVPRRPHPSA